jgi:hypothetical protein
MKNFCFSTFSFFSQILQFLPATSHFYRCFNDSANHDSAFSVRRSPPSLSLVTPESRSA